MLAYRNLAQIKAADGNAPPGGQAFCYAIVFFCDSLMICLFAYCASEYHRLFPAVQGLLEDFLRKIEHTFFEQQDDRRAAEAEQTFLLAAADNACLTVVFFFV